MKKLILIWSIMFLSIYTKGQYFDWNKVIFEEGDVNGSAAYYEQNVYGNGTQVIRYWYDPCTLCDDDYYECVVDSNGTVSDYYNYGYMNAPATFNYYDCFNNKIEIYIDYTTSQNPVLTYHLSNPVTINLSDWYINTHLITDTLKNLYLFYWDSSVEKYDSTGMLTDTFTIQGSYPKLNDAGEIFTRVGTNLYKYSNTGTFITQYPLTSTKYDIAKKSGKVWVANGNNVICYDSLANILFTISYSGLTDNISLAVDRNDNLFVWRNHSIYKYINDSLIWTTTVAGSNAESIGVDDLGNIYYVTNYAEPFYGPNGGGFEPGNYSVPPSVYFIGYETAPPIMYSDFYIISGKINKDTLPSFNMSIGNVLANQSLCNNAPFHVVINYDHLPINYNDSTVYIELSDSSGNFNNPVVIGQSKKLFVKCTVPDSIVEGNGYQFRARLGNSIITAPYSINFTLFNPPSAPIYLDNCIDSIYSCLPFVLKTNADTGLTYDWFYYDPSGNTYFPTHDSILNLTINYETPLGVTVIDQSTTCSRTSSIILPIELDTILGYSLSFILPDTIHPNDLPFNITVTGNPDTLYGNAVSFIPSSGYVFDPAVATPGLNAVTAFVNHNGMPCVPFQNTQYVFLDSIPRNIVVGEVEPSDKRLCFGDTVDIPFTLLDSSVYDSTNIFIVEMGNDSQTLFSWIADIGNGTHSPVKCIVPNISGKMRFRIRSSQTGETSTLNMNGDIKISDHPSVSFNSYQTVFNNCYPINNYIYINSSYGQHQWFLNDSLISDAIGSYIGITPVIGGTYQLTLTDTSANCSSILGPFEVNDSAHIPALSLTPNNSPLYSCGTNYPVLIAHTDNLSSIAWYKDSVQLPFTGDTLVVDTGGYYQAIATCYTGCVISSYKSRDIIPNPIIKMDVPLELNTCPGVPIIVSVNAQYNNPNYQYRWWKNNTQYISFLRQTYIVDTGYYYVIVWDQNQPACRDTSPYIHLTQTVIPTPFTTPSGTVILPHGQTLLLTTPYDSMLSYQWYRNGVPIDGADQYSHIATHYGSYMVKTTLSQTCFAFSNPVWVQKNPQIIEVDKLQDDGSNETDPDFDLYPNPNKGTFYIHGNNIASDYLSYTIEDIFGRSLLNGSLKTEGKKILKQISLGNIENGVYVVRINSADYSFSLPLVVY